MSALRRALLWSLLMGVLIPFPAFAQIPSSLWVTPDNVYKPPAEPSCYVITVEGAPYATLDLEMWTPWGPQTVYGWPTLDGNGQAYSCVDGSSIEGQYIFTGVRNAEYWFWGFTPVWAPIYVSPAPPPPEPPTITGNIEGIAQQGQDYYLVGWACAKTSPSSVDVHLYAGGPAGGGWGTFAVAATANEPSDGAIAAACYSSGTNYRFSILLTPSIRQQFGGLRVFVHGISPFGLDNLLIGNSGAFAVPPLAQQIFWRKDHIYTPGGAEVISATPQ